MARLNATTRQHEKLHGRDAEGGEGIDLFVALHGRDARGEARAGSAGKHHRGQDGRELAHGGDANEIGDEDADAEGAQLHGADEGEDRAHEEVHDADDEERARARFRHDVEHFGSAQLRPARSQARQQQDHLAEQIDEVLEARPALVRKQPDARGETGPGRHRRWSPPRLPAHEVEQVVQILRQALDRDLPAGLPHLLDERCEVCRIRRLPFPLRRRLDADDIHRPLAR